MSFLQSAFAFMLDLRESALATLTSARCGTRPLDLVWEPLSPPRSACWVPSSLGMRKKSPRKGRSFGERKN